jgi:membrane-associated PAP2 superfamily phosphatase
LLGLWFIAHTKRKKAASLAIGLGAGWLMGAYQMLNGSHFLSHTIVTMILAWSFALCFAALLSVPHFPPGVPKASARPGGYLHL